MLHLLIPGMMLQICFFFKTAISAWWSRTGNTGCSNSLNVILTRPQPVKSSNKRRLVKIRGSYIEKMEAAAGIHKFALI